MSLIDRVKTYLTPSSDPKPSSAAPTQELGERAVASEDAFKVELSSNQDPVAQELQAEAAQPTDFFADSLFGK